MKRVYKDKKKYSYRYKKTKQFLVDYLASPVVCGIRLSASANLLIAYKSVCASALFFIIDECLIGVFRLVVGTFRRDVRAGIGKNNIPV